MSPLDESAGEPIAGSAEQNGTDPRRLVLIDGEPWLPDIRFRMLQNPEIDNPEPRNPPVGCPKTSPGP